MVDFSKKLKGVHVVKVVDPIQIYADADRQATAGPLRPVQESVLKEWYEKRFDDKDVIIKLHTGEGKTLIGLLALQSRLNAGKGPCLYVCPSKQLAVQASNDATKFGIKHILDKGGDLPIDFTESKVIFITYIQRVFNGMSKFGIDNNYTKLGTVVLDDSHACIDSIRSAYTIKAKRDSIIFKYLLALFESSLKVQGEGSYLDIWGNKGGGALMQVPYWDWIDKKQEVSQFFHDHSGDDEVRFTYNLLKDIWAHCSAYFTSNGVEITPDYNLINRFVFFTKCGQRILMSATTQDDSFFIKGLGFSREAVLHPIVNKTTKWSGEKMILFPSRINESLSTYILREWMCTPVKTGLFSKVAIVPSFKLADEYKKMGAHIATGAELSNELNYLQTGPYDHLVVFVNRYDGIDLADNQCRILALDSLPTMGNLSDRYELACREDSQIINTKIAQKIEQGLGRSVRSEKDYSVILMIGEDLVRFVKTSRNQQLFSSQTRTQIKLGEDVTEMVKEDFDSSNHLKSFYQVIAQCLGRDSNWKQYYQETMDAINPTNDDHPLIDIIEKESSAEFALSRGEYIAAARIYSEISNGIPAENDLEKGWYKQLAAKCTYYTSKLEADKIQKSAHALNDYLLKPNGVHYKPVEIINQKAIAIIQAAMKRIHTFDDLNLKVDEVLADLTFGVSANKFEAALKEVGQFLGFISERPDQSFKVGPDNLWINPTERKFFAIECKNEVLSTRKSISKEEVGQMNNHIGWFEEHYGADVDVEYIHVHPVFVYSEQANYNKKVHVLTPERLEKLKKNFKSYINEFAKYKIDAMEDGYIQEALKRHQLTASDIVKQYTVVAVCEGK
ncbi:MAG: DEAD/DEAH box helicase family protein [Bacteroidales bacterium]|nr:DEAD/DEAH box helicase family protein [Bacteroidales bacterium]